MLTTQEEAFEKWCIKARDYHCDGDKCMAWRWSTAWGPPWKGYCGLAGKPEDEGDA